MTLREAIARAGYSQASFAEALGESKQRINNYVKGRHSPSTAMILRMESLLGIDLDIEPAKIGRPRIYATTD